MVHLSEIDNIGLSIKLFRFFRGVKSIISEYIIPVRKQTTTASSSASTYLVYCCYQRHDNFSLTIYEKSHSSPIRACRLQLVDETLRSAVGG